MGQSGGGRGRSRTLVEVFQPRSNSLNLLRLVMATGVIVFHSFALSGNQVGPWPLYQLLAYAWVDGFFAISGFLILRSWLARPDWRAFLLARAVRIYPAFWVCLAVTAFVIAPIGTLLQAGTPWQEVISADNFSYVWANASLVIFQYDIAGTPAGVPFPGNWNGSLWTLAWEFLCYLGVLLLGVLGLLRFRFTVPVVFAVALVAELTVSAGLVENAVFALASRFGLMFSAGMMLMWFERTIPVRASLVSLAAAGLLLSMLLPAYRPVGALLLAYVLVGTGALVHHPRLRLENDISYGTYVYAFPLQQMLACAGAAVLGPVVFMVFSLLLVWPAAALSWFGVEKPALRLKKRLRTRTQVASAVRP